jgi:hypothetical protein
MRRTIYIAISIACLAALLAGQTYGQSDPRVPIVVKHTGKDLVGSRVAYELREGIRRSQGMKLIASGNAPTRIVVHLLSTDESSEGDNLSSSISVVLALDFDAAPHQGYLLAAYLHNCGRERSASCAFSMLADLDGAIEKIRRDFPSQYRLLR